jgi:adenylylsulfate reductase subunit A
VDNGDAPNVDDAQVEALKAEILKPLDTFQQHKEATTDPDINPNYIRPTQFMYRLQKIMDEYAGGVSSQFKTSDKLLEKGMELLGYLKEDSQELAAENLHELMRCWENVHRMYQADAHMRSILFREETRWPGYYFRADKPDMNNADWLAFVNCKYDRQSGEWTMMKKPVKYISEAVAASA